MRLHQVDKDRVGPRGSPRRPRWFRREQPPLLLAPTRGPFLWLAFVLPQGARDVRLSARRARRPPGPCWEIAGEVTGDAAHAALGQSGAQGPMIPRCTGMIYSLRP